MTPGLALRASLTGPNPSSSVCSLCPFSGIMFVCWEAQTGKKCSLGGLCAHPDAPTTCAQTQNVTCSQGWPCAMVFSESGKVTVGMIRHVGFIKTCEFTHKGDWKACEGYSMPYSGISNPTTTIGQWCPQGEWQIPSGSSDWTPVE